MLKNKKAKLSSMMVEKMMVVILIIVVIFSAYSSIVPTAQEAGNELNNTNRCNTNGYYWNYTSDVCEISETNVTEVGSVTYGAVPLSGLFSANGIVFVILMAALIIIIVRQVMAKGKK